jgi:hypothetical protein
MELKSQLIPLKQNTMVSCSSIFSPSMTDLASTSKAYKIRQEVMTIILKRQIIIQPAHLLRRAFQFGMQYALFYV